MAEKQDSIFDRLQNGERVECQICHKGTLRLYNAPPNKAHSFICSNEKFNGHYHWDPVIDIE